MNLQQLEQELNNLIQDHEKWYAPIRKVEEECYRKLDIDGYSFSDMERDVEAVYRHRLDITVYNPLQAAFPVREALLKFYESATLEDRAEVRKLVWNSPYIAGLLLNYIDQCAECLEGPDDAWILRSGLIAAAIENYAHGDFRDTQWVLGELGRAAISAGIDIEPIAHEIASLCSPHKPGYMSTRQIIEDFHNFARRAWERPE